MTTGTPSRQPSDRQSSQPDHHHKDGTVVRLVAVLTAKAPQVVGLYLAVKEASREDVREPIVMLIALCILGVQAVEEIAMRVIDRLFGNGSQSSSEKQS